MKSAANFIDFFVHDILDFTLLHEDSEGFTKNHTVFNLRDAIDQIIETLEAKAQLKSLRVRKRFVGFENRAAGLMVNTDMKRL